ncbi:MAG: M28 family peptidase [Candidatus Eisenbacteria bacterium]|nr:M28 family peptidase [Candidatus Eisenbacteria bacterium]
MTLSVGETVARLILPCVLSYILAASGAGPSRGKTLEEAFSGASAWRADSVLSSAPFEGRRSGTAGGRAAEEWIAARFLDSGLLPASADQTFFQDFPVIGCEASKASLELLDGPFGRIRFVLGEDFTLLLTPADGKVTAEAVIVGYGIDSPQKERNDYGDVRLEGKIAVILREHVEDGRDWSEEYKRTHTFAAARARGAAAVLYVQGERPVAGAALEPGVHDPSVPAGFISKRIADLLLRETGWTLDDLKEKLKDGPRPVATGKRLRFEVKAKRTEPATGRNVLGMIRGSDPVLGSEVVIFGAHHDHLGIDAGGHLYPGANDNASGTAVVIEMARASRESGWKPRRSVLFVTFGGEEMGLLGSKRLAAHLPFDSSRAVAMLNLDMAGHGDGGFGLAGGTRLGPPYISWRAGLDSVRAASFEEYRLDGEHSDYSPFAARGIPALSAWSRGRHHRYHDIEDEARHVPPENLEAVGRGLASLLLSIADHPEPLADGYGVERALRADAIQIGFAPLDAAILVDPLRETLDGDGRIAGRLVLCDQGRIDTGEILRRLGSLSSLTDDRPWLRVIDELGETGDARDEMAVALLPVLALPTLEGIGASGARALCAAGLAGAILPSGAAIPSREVCRALADQGRFVMAGSLSGWREIARSISDLPLLVRWDRTAGTPPAPPDSADRGRVLLVLRVEGVADSAAMRESIASWGAQAVHIDIAAGLEVGVEDRESLQFLAWLRRRSWAGKAVEALLGGNLRRF